MPYTVNGCGTGYWGKSDRFIRRDFCEYCGRYTDLLSYDTTKFLTFFYLPFIPLGKRRILDSCAVCTGHRAVPLGQWRRARGEDVPEAIQAWRRQKSDLDAARAVMGLCLVYQDRDAFREIAAEMGRCGGADAAFQVSLGVTQEVLGDLESAEAAMRRALEIEPDPETNDLLAANLLKQSRPSDAWPMLESALAEKREASVSLMQFAVEVFQSEGKHDNALYVIEEVEKVFPETAGEKAWKKLKIISEKHIHTGKAVTSQTLKPVKAVDVSGNRFVAGLGKFVLPVLLLAGLGGYFVSAHNAGENREIIVVNGLPVPYSVTVNDQRVALKPRGLRRITVAEGELAVEVSGAGLDIPPQRCRVETAFVSRPFVDHTFFLNPDRAALVLWEKIGYAENLRDAAEPEFELHTGDLLLSFDDVDYVLTEFPGRVELPDGKPTTKQRVSVLADMPLARAAEFIAQEFDEARMLTFVSRQPLVTPEEGDLLSTVQIMAGFDGTLAFLEPMLDDRPVRVEAHRFYQESMQRQHPDFDLAGQYRSYLDAAPDDAALNYLLARVTRDRKEAMAMIKKAAEADPPLARFIGALGYEHLADGRFEEALANTLRAIEIAPDAEGLRSQAVEALMALGRLDEALAQHRRLSESTRRTMGRFGLELRLVARAQDPAAAQQRMAEYLGEIKPLVDEEILEAVKAYLDANLHYLAGETGRFVERMRVSAHPAGTLMAAIAEGDLVAASVLLEEDRTDQPIWPLLIYICACGSEGEAAAAARLPSLVEKLKGMSDEERQLAGWLAADELADPQGALALAMHPQYKRVALTALGLRHPDHQDDLFTLARQLNYEPDFPYILLRDVLDGKTVPPQGTPAGDTD